MTFARKAGTYLLGFTVYLAASACHGQLFDEQSLKRDAERVLMADVSHSVFSKQDEKIMQTRLTSNQITLVDDLMASRAAIEVTINPEARVSATRTGNKLPRFACQKAEPLLLRIVNAGHVSSNVAVHVRGVAEPGTVLMESISPRLSGASIEYRLLMLQMASTQPLDLTISIDVGPGTDDLNQRSQVSLLLNCSLPSRSK